MWPPQGLRLLCGCFLGVNLFLCQGTAVNITCGTSNLPQATARVQVTAVTGTRIYGDST